ncbi:MAG: hypothetical protein ACRD15_09790 [Vicinamibacterales bacterium]
MLVLRAWSARVVAIALCLLGPDPAFVELDKASSGLSRFLRGWAAVGLEAGVGG